MGVGAGSSQTDERGLVYCAARVLVAYPGVTE